VVFFLKEDIMKVFHDFHASGKFKRSLNAVFLVLIPKILGAIDSKDFRPISLVGSIYKIVVKILVNMLKMVLEKIISKSQNTFIRCRQILDPILIVNGCLNSRMRSGNSGVICKMDLEKAYDHINWNFLLHMLRRCGFGGALVLLDGILYFSVLVNSSPTGFFSSSRGLRQGDSVSPLLFVVVMEALGRMISTLASGGFLSCFCVGTWIGISHILFADDTLIFYGANSNHLSNLRCLVLFFKAVWGLKMNLAKLESVGNVDIVTELAGILGCGVDSLFLKYLGLSLGGSHNAKHVWDSVIAKIEHQLASWKRLYLRVVGLPLSRAPYLIYLRTLYPSFLSLQAL